MVLACGLGLALVGFGTETVPPVRASAGPSFSLRWNRRFRFDAERPLPQGMTFLPAAHCSSHVEALPGEMRFVRGDETLVSFAAPTNVMPPYEMHVMLTGAHTPAVFVTKDGATTLAGLPKWPEGFDSRVATLTNAVTCVVSGNLSEPKMSLSAGIGQADTRFVTTGRCNRPYRRDGRLFFTFSARGYGAYLAVMSFHPDRLDFRLEGVILFDYGDGLLRNDVAADLFYDDAADEWRAYVSNFSTAGDGLDRRAKGGLNCAWSKDCPLFGVSVMKAKSLDFDGMNEDPDGYWDERAKKWRLLVSEFVCGIGIRASLWESDRWDGPFVRLSGPVAEDSTGTTLVPAGDGLVALAGSSDRRFHLYDYPTLRLKSCLEVANPPWEASSSGNGRSWPAYAELSDGRTLLLTFDRVNFPGMPKPNWTYGGLFLYEGRSRSESLQSEGN